MARTKNPQRNKPKTKVGNTQSQNEANKTKNSKISNVNNKLPRKRQPKSSGRFKETITNEDGVDSSTEETAFKEAGGLKLQDIANIVIGDLKQVRVTEATFNIAEENNQRCFSVAAEVPNNGYESQTDEPQVGGCDDEKDVDAMCHDDGVSQTVEVSVVDQCLREDDVASGVDGDLDESFEFNGGYAVEDSVESEASNADGCANEPETCSTSGTTASIDVATAAYSSDIGSCSIANDAISDMADNVTHAVDNEVIVLQEWTENDENKCDTETQQSSAVLEEDEDFDLSIPEDRNESLNESYDDKDWVVCDESCDENLQTLEEEVETFSLLKSEDEETESVNCDRKCEPSGHADTECGGENVQTCDTVDVTANEESVSKINNYISVTMSNVFKSEIGVKRYTNMKMSDDAVQSSPKFVEKSSVLGKKYLKESSKSRKHHDKSKKPDKKESTGRQRKKSSVDRKTNDQQKERKSSSRRRRSDRLKSKPEYNEKYEGDHLRAPLRCDREKENGNREMKNENGEMANNVEKAGENATTFSGDTGDMPSFQQILENEYYTERSFSKDAERMICDCILTKEEIMRGELGCGEDCLNRLLLIECCSRCTLGDRCTNKRFQKREYAKCDAYKTAKKGYGLRVLEDIPSGTFIMEYVGEVINSDEFEDRAMKYARGKIPHFYFMSLKSDCIIDATVKGNFSRFINHSCEPNAETQKWTVQGELRIGFFSKRDIKAGEEVTFDYQLQRYGKQAQRCYCETPSCSGWIGEDPDKQTDDDKRKDRRKKKREDYLDWETALDEICQVGLINRHQTLSLNRLMVHAKELPVRMQILQLIEEGHQACRRLFVDYHGLPIIWSWMVDCTPDQDELKIQLLKTLMALPITNKTILVDSKVFSLVEQWAFAVDQKLQSEALSAQSVLESVEDIASAEETPVSEMAQKVLNLWSSLREAYRIPKKERIQQMKEHEREADQNIVKPRPRRLPVYAEKLRDRYHRNRYNKDFEKIYFDRLKDKRRKESPDRGHNRDHHRNKEGNKITRMEHRYMFEMKVAREDEERRQEAELMKRRWEEEPNYWNYYYSQQHQMMSGQYMASVPPTSYAANHTMVSPGMLQNMQSIATSRAHSHPYYASSSSYISPNIMLTHLAPPTPSPHSQQSTPSIMLPTQVNASPQTYYQNSVSISSYPNNTPPLPVPYPHQAINELTTVNSVKRAEVESENAFSYDYQALQSQHQQSTPLDEIPVPTEEQTAYSDASAYEYKENNLISVTSGEEQDLSTSFSSKDLDTAIANAAAAAVDLSKIKLPPKWKAARDGEGRIYYYHTKTRISQWYPPKWEEPQQVEEAEQTDIDESSEEESSADEEDEILETRKRRRKFSGVAEILRKRSHREEKEPEQSFDMDAEIKENLAAMSSEFQDSDNEDYSPVTKDVDDEQADLSDSELTNKMNTPPPSTVPLITEHIISPREPIDKEERIRNKKRRRSLKEKLKRQKRQQKMMALLNDSSSVADGSNGVNISTTISSSNSKLLSVPADTSSISDRQRKDAFRSTMANFVVNCLNPYFRSNCTTARITNYNDFKHLARKLTHFVMVKELKHCRNATELSCNSSVKHKAKEFIKKYMSRFGEVYVRPADDGNY